MFEFFRGRKRKLGCVTLMLACVFAAGWVRSLTIRDVVYFSDSNWTSIYCVVESCFSSITTVVESWPKEKVHSSWASNRLDDVETLEVLQSHERSVKWHWRFCGFLHGVEVITRASQRTRTVIPYWSIVVPPTLLSAWLLLSKPRAAKMASTESQPGREP